MITPGFRMSRLIRQLDGAALNPLLGKTAGVLLGYTLIFCVGCVVAWKL